MEAVCLRVLLFFDFVAALPATAGAVDSHLCCATFRVKYNFFEIRLTRFAQSIYACISLVFLSFYIFYTTKLRIIFETNIIRTNVLDYCEISF